MIPKTSEMEVFHTCRRKSAGHKARLLFIASALIFLLHLFSASSDARSVTLAWDPNSETGLKGYKLYYKTGSGGAPYNGTGAVEGPSPVDVKNVTTFTLTGLSDMESYYFVVTAYNTGGLESGYSNQASIGPVASNAAPVANAGADQTVDEGTSVRLDGSQSSDPDGAIASFSWAQTAGAPVTLDMRDPARPVFIAPTVSNLTETFSFTLTVTDSVGATSTDACSVTVRQVADPGGTAALPFLEDFETEPMAACWDTYSTGRGRVTVTNANGPFYGNYHLVMDSGSSGTFSLNELTLTIDLAGKTGVVLGFYHKELSDEDHVMPSSFSGSHNSDGVAVSADGKTWHKVQGLSSVDGISSAWKRFEVDLDAAVAKAGIRYTSAFKIKFQQYDNYPAGSDGFAFDEISLDVQ